MRISSNKQIKDTSLIDITNLLHASAAQFKPKERSIRPSVRGHDENYVVQTRSKLAGSDFAMGPNYGFSCPFKEGGPHPVGFDPNKTKPPDPSGTKAGDETLVSNSTTSSLNLPELGGGEFCEWVQEEPDGDGDQQMEEDGSGADDGALHLNLSS